MTTLPTGTTNRKIRVLSIMTRMTIGGGTNVILDITEHFNNHPKFEAHLALGPVPDREVDLTHLAHERNIPTKIIPNMVNHMNPFHNMRAMSQLIALMLRGKYDIVHTHTSVAGVIGRMAALVTRVPVIVHHLHGWGGLQEDMSLGMPTLYVSLERLCAKFTDRLIAVSQPTIQKGLAHRICQEDKFALIYNGIQLEQFRQPVDEQQVRQELNLDPGCKLVGMIGRLDKQKNPLDFIRAAAIVIKAYPQAHFLLIGEGSLRPDCERLIDELNLQDKFTLLGFRSDIDKIMPILTLTAMSSLWEGLPVVFQEAMSAGIPIVANDVDGASDVVIEGKTGYLVTPHQPQEMAERILSLLRDERLCSKMGNTASQLSERFSSQKMVNEIESLYSELLTRREPKLMLGEGEFLTP